MAVGATERHFDIANEKLRGDYEIGPFTSCAVTDGGDTVYIVYHDLAQPVPLTQDGNFDVFLLEGTRSGQNWSWSAPRRINAADTGTNSDQFMPTITVDESTGRLHIAYYDTRGASIRGDIKIGLTYTWSDNATTFNEIPLDNDVINESYLLNDRFFGDHIDIIWWDTEEIAAVILHRHDAPAGRRAARLVFGRRRADDSRTERSHPDVADRLGLRRRTFTSPHSPWRRCGGAVRRPRGSGATLRRAVCRQQPHRSGNG